MNNLELQKLLIMESRKELARTDYSEYCKYVHRGNWILGNHLKLICEEVENMIYRKVKENILCISLPPQHGKSQCVSETLPSYCMGKFDNYRVIELSYGDDLASKFGRKNGEKVAEFGKELFNVEPIRKTDKLLTTTNGGELITGGIMSGVTGNPGDLIIVDDPIKNRQEADSQTYRDRVWEEYLATVNTRLSAKGVVIVIMTRWHEDDLVGRLLKTVSHRCRVINIPLQAEDNDILGRQVGDSLFPEIGKNNEWLKDFKELYLNEEGSRTWYALMQGRPTAQEGNLFKREWFNYYDKRPVCPLNIMTVDATFKDTSKSDYVAIEVWGKRNEQYYLIDLIKKRMGFVETVQAIKTMKNKHRYVQGIYIEDKANGSAIIDVLRREISGVVAYAVGRDSKESRASSVSPIIESGSVFIPQFEQFVGEFIEECCQFPNSANDDLVDGMVMALSVLRRRVAKVEEKKDEHYDSAYGRMFESDYEQMIYDVTGMNVNQEIFKWGDFI